MTGINCRYGPSATRRSKPHHGACPLCLRKRTCALCDESGSPCASRAHVSLKIVGPNASLVALPRSGDLFVAPTICSLKPMAHTAQSQQTFILTGRGPDGVSNRFYVLSPIAPLVVREEFKSH